MALAISHRTGLTKKLGPSKLAVGVLVSAMTAFVGLAGVAGATSDMPTQQWCQQHHFKNHGQCVSAWKHLHHMGGGYGGYGSQNITANVATDLNFNVTGNNNVFNIVINYIFGGHA